MTCLACHLRPATSASRLCRRCQQATSDLARHTPSDLLALLRSTETTWRRIYATLHGADALWELARPRDVRPTGQPR